MSKLVGLSPCHFFCTSISVFQCKSSLLYLFFVCSWFLADMLRFNKSRVTSTILLFRKAKARSKALFKFTRIAFLLRALNNYNTLTAILAGINSAPILRLRETRRFVEDKLQYHEYLKLEALMTSEKSFARYRCALRNSQSPCVPYL